MQIAESIPQLIASKPFAAKSWHPRQPMLWLLNFRYEDECGASIFIDRRSSPSPVKLGENTPTFVTCVGLLELVVFGRH